MKYLFFTLLAACSACNLNDSAPSQPVAVAVPVVAKVAQPPADPRANRPNGSCAYFDYRIVHTPDAAAFAAEVNRLLDEGYFLRGELRTASGSGIGPTGFEYVQAMSKQ